MKQKLVELKGKKNLNLRLWVETSNYLTQKLCDRIMSKDTEELHNTARQQDLIDVSKTLHPTTRASLVTRYANGKVNKTDHIMGSKTNLKKLRRIENI